jgi:hypothetical protein
MMEKEAAGAMAQAAADGMMVENGTGNGVARADAHRQMI